MYHVTDSATNVNGYRAFAVAALSDRANSTLDTIHSPKVTQAAFRRAENVLVHKVLAH